eukprot:c18517_g1_i1.p1 GENE.c18517_g1_i1~~c18517_g1_i1.p1  ORF type:complete len:144 (+),score=65.30 c18517_g1_i1:215-646(+)
MEEVEKRDAESGNTALECAKLREKIVQLQVKLEKAHIENLAVHSHNQLDQRCRELLRRKQMIRANMKENEQKKRILNQEKELEEKIVVMEKELVERVQKMKQSFCFEQKWYISQVKQRNGDIEYLTQVIENLKSAIEHTEGIY